MTRSLVLVLALLSAAACSPKADADLKETDAAAVDPNAIPANPAINLIATGKAIDPATASIVPTVDDEFAPGDTIFVSIATSHTAPGAKVTLMLMQGDKHLGGASGSMPEAAADGYAHLALFFAPTTPWPIGEYQITTTLDGKPQAGAIIKVVK